jgi:hypothetical protein
MVELYTQHLGFLIILSFYSLLEKVIGRFLYLVGQVHGPGVYLYMEVVIEEALVWNLYGLGILLLANKIWAGFGIDLLLTRYGLALE